MPKNLPDLSVSAEGGEWLESEGVQVIATRVSTGPECSIIQDGYVAGEQLSELLSDAPLRL